MSMKRIYRKALLFILMMMTGFFVTSFRAVAAQVDEGAEEPFEVTFTYGMNGMVNWNRKIPVTVSLTNKGGDFEGRAVLMSYYGDSTYYSSYYDKVAYIADVLIPAGETRDVNFSLPVLSGSDRIILYIEDAKGNTVFEKDEPVSLRGSSLIYMGILSDEPDRLDFLAQGDFTLRSTGALSAFQVISLTDGDLSRNLAALDILNLLIITDFDTSSLSDRQYGDIKQWVDRGGILLIGTGPAYNKTLSGFDDDYITGTIGSLEKKEAVFPFRENLLMNGSDGADTGLTYDAVDIRMDKSREFPEWSFQMLEKGKGKVLIFDFDLSSREIFDWSYRFDYFEGVLNTVLTGKDWSGFFEDNSQSNISSWRLRYSITNTFFDSLPSVVLYLNVLLLYVVLILVLYLLLKKLDKRHLMWAGIPALSVFFGIIIFILGSGTRQRDVFMNYAAVIHEDDGLSEEKVYFSTTSPKNKDYSFDVDGSYSVHPAENYNYYGLLEGPDKKYEVGLNQSPAKTTLEVKNVSSFQTKYYVGARTAASAGGMKVEVIYGGDGLTGTITNETGFDLTDCGLILYRSVLYFGNLANGETVRMEDCLEDSVTGYYSYNISDFLLKESEDMTIAETGLRLSKRNLLSEELDTFLFGNWVNQCLFIGFTLDYEPDICNTIAYDINGYTLLMAEAEVEYMHNGKVSIPNISGYINMSQSDTDFYYSEDGVVFYGEVLEAFYDFGIDMAVEEIGIRFDYMASYLDVYFYDFEASDYVKVFDGMAASAIGSKLNGDLSRYFDMEGHLYIRAVNLDYNQDRYYYESYLPTISITGRVK